MGPWYLRRFRAGDSRPNRRVVDPRGRCRSADDDGQRRVWVYTHAIFYLTDFGETSLPPSLDAARVSAVVDSAIAWQIGQRNYDLLGEFLVCAALLGSVPSPHGKLGLALWNGQFGTNSVSCLFSFSADVFQPL